MIRICHFSSAHSANDIRIFGKECRSLARAGYDVHLVAGRSLRGPVDGVTIHPLTSKPHGRIRRIAVDPWVLYRQVLALDAEIYHFHDPELLVVGLMLKRAGKIVIYDAHEDLATNISEKSWLPSLARRPVASAVIRVERYVSKRLDAVVAATPHIRSRLGSYQEQTVDIRNYPDLTELPSRPTEPRPFAERDTAVYIGSITVARGIHEMVLANDRASSSLTLAGNFAYGSERTETVSLPGWSRVIDRGTLDRSEIWKLLGSAYAGLVLFHPTHSHVSAMPTKLFEYMAAGIPVIASNFSLWRDIVEGADCGICVDPLDPEAIASAMTYLRTNPDLAGAMGARGRQSVHELYSWAAEERKLLSLYNDLLI